jgi:hypothetical protein
MSSHYAAVHESAAGTNSPGQPMGRARQFCPGISDLDFLRDLKGVVDLDAQIANGAFDLGMAQQ